MTTFIKFPFSLFFLCLCLEKTLRTRNRNISGVNNYWMFVRESEMKENMKLKTHYL